MAPIQELGVRTCVMGKSEADSKVRVRNRVMCAVRKVGRNVAKRALAAETKISESYLAEERNELSKKEIRTMHPTKDASLPLDEKMVLPCARFPSSGVTTNRRQSGCGQQESIQDRRSRIASFW